MCTHTELSWQTTAGRHAMRSDKNSIAQLFFGLDMRMSDAWMLVQPGNSSAAALRSSVVQTYYEVSCGQLVL